MGAAQAATQSRASRAKAAPARLADLAWLVYQLFPTLAAASQRVRGLESWWKVGLEGSEDWRAGGGLGWRSGRVRGRQGRTTTRACNKGGSAFGPRAKKAASPILLHGRSACLDRAAGCGIRPCCPHTRRGGPCADRCDAGGRAPGGAGRDEDRQGT